MYPKEVVEQVKKLRLQGQTYSQIRAVFNLPKATLSGWCRGLTLNKGAVEIWTKTMHQNLVKARIKLNESRKTKRNIYLQTFIDKNQYLQDLLKNQDCAKLALAMLYLGEGAKSMKRKTFMFGNSNPSVIKLFLKLFRKCYAVDESKFRCTVQCRADQDTGQLEQFWYNVTGILLKQFYKPRIDPRTIGKVSDKVDYKGVCRIDYFSTPIFLDIIQTITVLTAGP